MPTTPVLTDEHPFPEGYTCSTSTPWGAAQVAYRYARGIINYSCAGHGGFHLSATRNALVDPAWQNANGWYEEDCEWAIVAITFPEAFAPKHVRLAHTTAKSYFPDAYAAAIGPVSVEESYVLQERAFYAAHANDFIVTSAQGDWAKWVPTGFVGVTAQLGGRGADGCNRGPEKRFLVPVEEYEARRQGKHFVNHFVVDLARHQELEEVAA